MICWLLSLILLMSSVPMTVFAVDANGETTSESATQAESGTTEQGTLDPVATTETQPMQPFSMQGFVEMKEGDLTLEELKTKTVDLASLPEFISAERAMSKGHVNRVMAQEGNLATVVYQNSDGTKSTYIFNAPVKYIDADGTVKDKSTKLNSLMDSIYSYGMTQNLAKAYFANLSSNGVKVDVGEYSIVMKPVSSVSANVTYVDENTVRYDGVYGAFTSLVYETKMSGVKEYVMLGKNIGVNEFAFVLMLEGLTPVEIDGIWYLQNAENVIIASLGAIEITDSVGQRALGTMSVTPGEQSGSYNVLITVPESFLSDPTTEYPVLVDPTTYIYEEGVYRDYDEETMTEISIAYNAITDTGLYSNSNAMMDVGVDYHIVGDVGSFEGKVLYKLYDFYGEYGQFKDLDEKQVGKVTFYIHVGSGIPTTFTVNPMASTWSVETYGEDPTAIYGNSALWNDYDTAISCSVETNLSNGGEYGIDITPLVKAWLGYDPEYPQNDYSNPAKGFVLSASSDTYRFVDAVEEFYSDSVYFAIDTSPIYGEHYINNQSTGKFLKKSGTNSLTASLYEDTDLIKWKFEYIGNDLYYIRSADDDSYYLHGSGSNVNLAQLTGSDKSAYQWKIVDHCTLMNYDSDLVLCFNGTSLSLVSERAETHENYAQTQWSLVSTEINIALDDFGLHDTFLLPNSSKTFYVEAETFWNSNANFTWTIVSDAGGNNTFAVDQNGTVTASQYGGTATLTVTHKPTGCVKVFTIKCGAIREGEYMLMNKATNRYAEIEGPSTSAGALIQQWECRVEDWAKWRVTILENGSYTIQSVYSGLWLSSGRGATFEQIIQGATVNIASKWYISQTASGAYTLSPANDNTRVLAVPEGTTGNGTDLVKVTHSIDADYRDEWIFDNVGPTFGVTHESVYNIVSKYDNKVLGAVGGAETDGTPIEANVETNSYQWQRWKFYYVGNGEYRIQDVHSKKYLAIVFPGDTDDCAVELRPLDTTDNKQIFKIKRDEADETVSFHSKSSYYTLSLTVNTTNNRLYQDTYHSQINQKFTLKDRNKAIIIVPGFFGSELYVGNGNENFAYGMPLFTSDIISVLGACLDEENSWASLIPDNERGLITQLANYVEAIDLVADWYDALMCDEDGNSASEVFVKEFREASYFEVQNDGTIQTNYLNCGLGNSYSRIYKEIKDKFVQQYVVDIFFYDWRLSNAVSADKLDQYINKYEYDEVILVSHSMGGLVASGYLARGEAQRNNIDQVYYLASPLLGIPATEDVWFNENVNYFNDFNVLEQIMIKLVTSIGNPIRNLISNYISVYELFPSKYYFSLTEESYLSFDLDGTGTTECHSYSETLDLIVRVNGNHFDLDLMSLAENFHDSTFIGDNHISAYVDSYYLYGSGFYNTPLHVHVYYADTMVNGIQKLALTIDERTPYGDSLVPDSSAALANKYPEKVFYWHGSGHSSFIGGLSRTVAEFIERRIT